jgi:cell division protease FtsH
LTTRGNFCLILIMNQNNGGPKLNLNQNNNSPKKPKGKFEVWIPNILTLLALTLVFMIILSFNSDFTKGLNGQTKPKDFSELVTDIRTKKVSKIEVGENKDIATVEVYKNPGAKDRKDVTKSEYKLIPGTPLESTLKTINEGLKDGDKVEIGSEDGKIVYTQKEKTFFQKLFEGVDGSFLFSILLLSAVGYFLLRRLAETSGKQMSFGNSRAKLYMDSNSGEKKTFADVAGNEEAKQELLEVVDFLKRPEEYTKMGAKIPRGVLLIGGPGNGKTLMAKAVAGEADVPFLYVSGSEFVEMFVGVGASRVRDLFKEAKKKSPCVIFIDEIDAVGRKRGQGTGGGNDEREQTLNQFLVEMDGFEGNESVIVLAATNRPDVLDQALLRPGRFDRQVTVTSPDRKERELILKVHSKNKKLASNIDMSIVAKRTAGFSGADLMNVLNEGAILAVREKQTEINNDTLREAIEKVMLGPSLKTKVVTEQQKKLTAFHEAGHAIAASVLAKAKKVQKITIIPRGRAAGYTFNTDDETDSMTRSKLEFLSEITVLFGGYSVEENIFGDITTGASNDLAKANQIAWDMVTKYGMSSLGPISVQESSMKYDDRAGSTNYGSETGNKIDLEVKKILETCHNNCKEIITKYRPSLDAIANSLIENEVLEYEDFETIIAHIKDSFVPSFEI